jgi:hypothetical protein
MSVLKGIQVRPVSSADLPQLEEWREKYPDAFLALQHGVQGSGVETVCAEKDGRLIGSLTGVHAVIIDPFIHNTKNSGADIFAAAYLMERTLSFLAQKGGAISAYTSVATNLTAYQKIVERSGYIPTFQNCNILRRPF